MIQRSQYHIMSDQRIIPNRDATLILKFASGIKEYLLSYSDVLAAIRIKRRKQSNTGVHALSYHFGENHADLLGRVVTTVQLGC